MKKWLKSKISKKSILRFHVRGVLGLWGCTLREEDREMECLYQTVVGHQEALSMLGIWE